MIEIKRATTKRDFKKFVRFPDKLYRGNEFYVPPIEFDELNMTNPKKNACYEECEVSYFLAYKDGELVGRISGIISHPYNKKNNAKYARFSRFECINDQEVANKLFEAAESWAKEQGMEKIHGPLGFNDLEREGLQVEGFDVMGTFQEAYNYPYYKDLVENAGYVPDAKWVEWRIPIPEKVNERTAKLAKYVGERYGFYEKKFKNKKEVIKNYGREFFKLLDECFVNLYGTVPFNEKLVDQTIGLFNLVLDPDYISLVFNREDELIGFGLGYPSLAKAMNKSHGRIFPFGWARLLHAIKHPKVIELGLIAVKPKYQKMGVTAVIITNMMERMIKNKIQYADTGVQLENNTAVLTSLDMFDRKLIRRKVCYIKDLK